mgnify:CR=1 FL=1
MKITETITRECCRWPDDLTLYFGKQVRKFPEPDGTQKTRIWFCKHCGQLWHWMRSPGEIDGGLERLEIAWVE